MLKYAYFSNQGFKRIYFYLTFSFSNLISTINQIISTSLKLATSNYKSIIVINHDQSIINQIMSTSLTIAASNYKSIIVINHDQSIINQFISTSLTIAAGKASFAFTLVAPPLPCNAPTSSRFPRKVQ